MGTLLRRVIAALDGGAQQVYDRHELDFRPRYFPIARQLLDHGPAPVGQLSEMLGVTQPAISQTLKEMENDGLIAFEAGEDRRVRLAGLTRQGLSQCRRLRPIWDAVAQSADELNAEIDADLPALLRRLIAALDERPFATRIEEKLS
ncbi:MAG TPA: MarR family transcriptional regulator [Sphingomicrobium sp.]